MIAGGAVDASGDRAERFKTLALPHLDDIYTLARYLLRSASDADDAVQECYLRAFRHFDTFRGGPVKPWLFAILRNVCHAAYAGNARLVFTAEEEPQAKPVWREDSRHARADDAAAARSETVRRLIGELPAEFREVIVLREINDLSYRDIATVIEAPIGTVMSRLARARGMLRDASISAEGEGIRHDLRHDCDEADVLMHALIDGELDAAHARHVDAYRGLRPMRGALARVSGAAQGYGAGRHALYGAGGFARAHRRQIAGAACGGANEPARHHQGFRRRRSVCRIQTSTTERSA